MAMAAPRMALRTDDAIRPLPEDFHACMTVTRTAKTDRKPHSNPEYGQSPICPPRRLAGERPGHGPRSVERLAHPHIPGTRAAVGDRTFYRWSGGNRIGEKDRPSGQAPSSRAWAKGGGGQASRPMTRLPA